MKSSKIIKATKIISLQIYKRFKKWATNIIKATKGYKLIVTVKKRRPPWWRKS